MKPVFTDTEASVIRKQTLSTYFCIPLNFLRDLESLPHLGSPHPPNKSKKNKKTGILTKQFYTTVSVKK